MFYKFNIQLYFLLSLIGLSTYNAFAKSTQPLIPHGSQQMYELLNTVTVKDLKHSSNQETSYKFTTRLKVNSVWHSVKDQLLQVFIYESEVEAPAKANGKWKQLAITKIPDRPFYISMVDGQPSKVIAHTSRDQSLLNLERGIASLLQLRPLSGPVTELDISGQCKTFYERKTTTKITKTKSECSNWDLRVNYRSEKPLGVHQQSHQQVNFHLTAEGALISAKSSERHSVSLTAKPDVGSQVESDLILQHLAEGQENVQQLSYGTLDEAVKSLLDKYRVFDIEADVDGVLSEIKHTTLSKQIKVHADELADDHVGKETLAVVIAELLPLARISKQEEFVKILNKHQELQNQLIDLLGAVQTIDAHNAINEVYKFEEKTHVDYLEKYLQALSVGTHPDRAIIEDLFERLLSKEKPIKNEKLRDTVIQTVSALTHQSNFDVNDSLLQKIREYFLQELNTNCKGEVACVSLYLRALGNLRDASTLDAVLLHALESEEPKINVAAMQAVHSFPLINFKENHRKIFSDIFYQRRRKYDSSARTLALDILMSMKPTKQELGDLLDYLSSNDRHFEVKTFVIQKFKMLAEKCPRFRSLLDSCLAERPKVNNYHVIGQKGLTTVLERQLSQSPAYNETLLSIQEIYKGVLKRGSVELILKAGREEASTFKLGIYTNGLTSFVGGDEADDLPEDNEVDDSPATAGMEISVQGVSFRPLVFFNGQGELMGHVWSGTASEPTPAYQATTLAQDHEHYIILGSGATVYSRIIGTRSIDLNGKVEMSLWNRNANTEIHQNSGAAVVGLMVAGFTYAKVENEFLLANEPKISLQANIDFYDGIKLCIQLQRPEMTLSHLNTRSVHLESDESYTKNVRTKLTHKFPGRTLALNQKNNEMCNMIFTE